MRCARPAVDDTLPASPALAQGSGKPTQSRLDVSRATIRLSVGHNVGLSP